MNKIIIALVIYLISTSLSFAQVSSEDVMIKNDSIQLPGTLSYTDANQDLIIWIHGSGNVDRNGNQAEANIKANYIKQFRDAINKEDIAFFSYDKRTANPENAALLAGIRFTDLVEDAKVVIKYLKEKHTFKSITLVGHSQGSLIAMLASEGIQKYVSLAGPGESIDETIIKQITVQSAPLGEVAKAHAKELKETGTIKEINPFLVSLFRKENHAFLAEWFQYNPVTEIGKLTIPVLIINGTKDIQVKEVDANQLHTGNKKSELVLIDKMNHVLKVIEKDADNMASYYSADFPISEELINVITKFVKQ